ncbi:hypothetical protein K437DRAFT_189895 [Tilletiaria anomala UBC 951]|uniref:Uncharacterized protein n=1 Tax=Tilletiaria anomala (strain ATCC 24038 / CBS 436.72 / UBC 951) TaxID=1037660 RepID=A0A066VFY0_TILAU|nr:uncharacterized protein K437DRAFT_189895 [Tilletiaria anomala UBC 951]KDN40336.1 hypothetical protein K437DRAFT_189895 [Tilletiaria anomala UBC 951]
MFQSSTSIPHTVGPPRLKLVGRSVSDFSPVCESDEWKESAASAQRAHVGGIKVVSGGKLVTGGFAPFSPFLPLPPPPTMDEVTRHFSRTQNTATRCSSRSSYARELDSTPRGKTCVDGGLSSGNTVQRPHTPEDYRSDQKEDLERPSSPSKHQRMIAEQHEKPNSAAMSPASSGSSSNTVTLPACEDVNTLAAASSSSVHTRYPRGSDMATRTQPRSACMLRSFSVPVATQAEFDHQSRLMSWGSTALYDHNSSFWAAGWPSSASPFGGLAPAIDANNGRVMARRASQISPDDLASVPSAVHVISSSGKRPQLHEPVFITNTSPQQNAPLASPRQVLASITNSPRTNEASARGNLNDEPFYVSDSTIQDSPSALALSVAAVCKLNDESADGEKDLEASGNINHQGFYSLLMPGLSPDGNSDHSGRGSHSSYTSDDTEDAGARTPRVSPTVHSKTASYFGSSQSSTTHDQLPPMQTDAFVSDKHDSDPGQGSLNWATFIHPDHML